MEKFVVVDNEKIKGIGVLAIPVFDPETGSCRTESIYLPLSKFPPDDAQFEPAPGETFVLKDFELSGDQAATVDSLKLMLKARGRMPDPTDSDVISYLLESIRPVPVTPALAAMSELQLLIHGKGLIGSSEPHAVVHYILDRVGAAIRSNRAPAKKSDGVVSIDVPLVPTDGYAPASFSGKLSPEQARTLSDVGEALRDQGVLPDPKPMKVVGWILDQVRAKA